MTLDRSQIKKGGQLAGMPKFLWLVLFFVVTLCCCRMSYWSGMKLKRKAEAQGLSQSHARGMQGPSCQDCSGSSDWSHLGTENIRK